METEIHRCLYNIYSLYGHFGLVWLLHTSSRLYLSSRSLESIVHPRSEYQLRAKAHQDFGAFTLLARRRPCLMLCRLAEMVSEKYLALSWTKLWLASNFQRLPRKNCFQITAFSHKFHLDIWHLSSRCPGTDSGKLQCGKSGALEVCRRCKYDVFQCLVLEMLYFYLLSSVLFLLLLLTSFDCFGECDSKGLASLQLLIEVSTPRG